MPDNLCVPVYVVQSEPEPEPAEPELEPDTPLAVQHWIVENTGPSERCNFDAKNGTLVVNHKDNPPEDAATYTLEQMGIVVESELWCVNLNGCIKIYLNSSVLVLASAPETPFSFLLRSSLRLAPSSNGWYRVVGRGG